MGVVGVNLPHPFFWDNKKMKRDDQIQLVDEKQLSRMNRRELLKLVPLIAMGAIAIPSLNEKLIKRGLQLGDRAAEKFFSEQRLAQTFSNRDVTPFEKFPVNSYSDYDPANDLANWKLTVEGMVARPGDYTMEQINALPKQVQNVKHICIEGWDVIGNFGGVRLADFLQFVGADSAARCVRKSSRSRCPRRATRPVARARQSTDRYARPCRRAR